MVNGDILLISLFKMATECINRSLAQIEEELALSSIYGNDFQIISNQIPEKIWKINVYNDDEKWCSLILQIHLPQEYPEKQPPIYELFSDCLSNDDLGNLSKSLDQLWKENEGECIVYHWIERCREFIQQKYHENELTKLNAAESQDTGEEVIDFDYEEADSTELFEFQMIDQFMEMKMQNDDKQDQIEVISGEPIVDRKSTFQAHIGFISEESQVGIFMKKLTENRKIARASHNIMAYRIEGTQKGNMLQDNDDDGENEAGSRLMHLLQILDVKNIIIVVSRWYGGILLGPDRFKHINNCARDLIVKTGLVKQNQSAPKRNNQKPKTRKK